MNIRTGNGVISKATLGSEHTQTIEDTSLIDRAVRIAMKQEELHNCIIGIGYALFGYRSDENEPQGVGNIDDGIVEMSLQYAEEILDDVIFKSSTILQKIK